MVHKSNFLGRLLKALTVILVALVLGLQAIETRRQHSQDPHKAHRRALTPLEWTRKYRCSLTNETNSAELQTQEDKQRHIELHVPWYKRFWFNLMHECNRDQLAWRLSYIDEVLDQFTILINDRTSDERLANIVHSLNSNGLIDLFHFKFNSGSTKLDRSNELRVAGKSVNDQQCARDLAEMSLQLDELQARLERLRTGVNSSAGQEAGLEERHLRLVRVLDAYGRYESGALSGNTRLVGNYGQCMKTTLERVVASANRESGEPMEMRYCWARMSLLKHTNALIRNRQRQKHETGDDVLAVGVCLPKTCHTKNVNAAHKATVKKFLDSQFILPSSMFVDQHFDLESVFCLADKDGEFGMPTSGKLCLLFAFAWVLLCCLITYFRIGQSGSHEELAQIKEQQMNAIICAKQNGGGGARKERHSASWNQVAKCFDLSSSWREFTSDRRQLSSTDLVDLDVLNPIKIFASVFCVAAHSALMFASICRDQIAIAGVVERDVIIQTALLASVVVDTFFVISGILLTYITCRKLAAGYGVGGRCGNESRGAQADLMIEDDASGTMRGSPSGTCNSEGFCTSVGHFFANWFVLALNRYLRLVPLFALMHWFRRDVITYIGSGPFWDYGFNRETSNGGCNHEGWLVPLSFVSAFMPLSKQCYVPSWSISNDIFFGLLIPPFILMLRKRSKLAIRSMVYVGLVCMLLSLYAFNETSPPERWELIEFRLHGVVMLFNGLSKVYTWPIYRVPSFLIGAIAGYALFSYSQKSHELNVQLSAKTAHWPVWFTGAATRTACIYLVGHTFLSVFLINIKELIDPYHRLLGFYMVTLDRALWSASNAVIFLRMMSDWKDGPMMQRFAGQCWRTLARLNYAIIFIHWIFIVVQIGVMTTLPSFNYWNLFASFAGVFLLSLPFAVFVHVIFENPTDKLIKRQIFKL